MGEAEQKRSLGRRRVVCKFEQGRLSIGGLWVGLRVSGGDKVRRRATGPRGEERLDMMQRLQGRFVTATIWLSACLQPGLTDDTTAAVQE